MIGRDGASQESTSTPAFAPFVLVSDELIFLPSPLSANVAGYRKLFRQLHADPDFCETAFGAGFEAREWSDGDARDVLLRDARKRWEVRGMGDFALGILSREPQDLHEAEDEIDKPASFLRTAPKGSTQPIRIIQDAASLTRLFTEDERMQWVGYVCVRDALPQCAMPSDTQHALPPWQEMIEVRYGLDPAARGKGIITRAQNVVMQWAVEERGARRFIAETLISNDRSAKALERLGFVRSGTSYFGLQDTIEWYKNADPEPLRNEI